MHIGLQSWTLNLFTYSDKFKTWIDEFWKHQEVLFKYESELSGTGNQSQISGTGNRSQN